MAKKKKEKVLLNPDADRCAIVPQLCINKEGKECDKIFKHSKNDMVCMAYADPNAWFRKGKCPLNSNNILEETKSKKVNPIKWSKRHR